MLMILRRIRLWWVALRKVADAFVDALHPNGYVELLLIHANGPKKGQVAKRVQGRNVVTGFLSDSAGAAPTSGRDLMRRLLIPQLIGTDDYSSLSLNSVSGCSVSRMVLGSGTSAESADDTGLDTEVATTNKALSDITCSVTEPDVTFVANWNETEANHAISEVGLLSGRDTVGDGTGTYDFLARKTFSAFTKTSDFTLQIRWTLRF